MIQYNNNLNNNNSVTLKVSPAVKVWRLRDIMYCGFDGEVIELLSKFTKYSLRLINNGDKT